MTMWSPEIEEDGPLALAITRALESDVRNGKLRPGDRLPTHRDLATDLGVNVGTVSRAYSEARRRGLIRGEVGRGTFVREPGGTALKPRTARGGRAIVDLTVNIPQAHPAPDAGLALRELADSVDLGTVVSYRDPAGSERARRAGAIWLRKLGVEAEAEDIVVCAGAQHGILVAVSSVVGPGELVLAESLTYPGFQGAARLLGLRVGPIEMDEQGIVPAALEAACAVDKPRLLYCMPTLQNPTAAMMGAARRSEIVEIARRHDLMIVQDEVHGGIVEDPAPSLATLAPERVITIAGVSKILLPGLRIAFVSGPPERAGTLAELVWSSIWMASPLGGELAAKWIEDGTADRTLAARRRDMDARHEIARDALAGCDFATRPGSYHLWLRLPRHWDAAGFTAAALDRGVAVSAAESFVVAPSRAPAAVRISLTGTPDHESLRESLEMLATLSRESAPAPAVRL